MDPFEIKPIIQTKLVTMKRLKIFILKILLPIDLNEKLFIIILILPTLVERKNVET